MSANPMTVPHAPITRTNHRTGEVDHPEIGSFVNVKGAQIQVEGVNVIVHLDGWDWQFECATPNLARGYAHVLKTRGQM